MMPLLHILLLLLFAGRTIDQTEIRELIEQYVYSNVDTTGVRVEVELRSAPSKVMNIPSGAELRVVNSHSNRLRGLVTVPIEVIRDGRVEHTFLVSVKIRKFRRVLKSVEKVEKGTEGGRVTVVSEVLETTGVTGTPLAAAELLGGLRTKRMIQAGAILMKEMFEPIPVLKQGATVRLIVRAGGVLISTRALAKEDGYAGEFVMVQKVGTHERLKVRVLDGETVELLTIQ